MNALNAPFHGVNTPLFSLRTEKSGGIGEFLDLLPFIDWVATCGFNTIQLLPINDLGRDASPYNALSAFALNPLHLSLDALPDPPSTAELKVLNELPSVDYPEVRKIKEALFESYFTPRLGELMSHPDYIAFKNQNPWLEGYARFKGLKVAHNWSAWKDWPNMALTASNIEVEIAVQYYCFKQMEEVKQYAEKKGIFLLGDLPILVSPDSADVWEHQEMFDLSLSAGAPPDMYAAEGQKWGFPLYRWESMETNGYKWWKERLAVSSRLFHLYRIDHIVGFYRIWAIPGEAPAAEGYFVPEDPSVWIEHGEKILTMMLQNTSMQPIGEDLGIVPPSVRESLTYLGIPGTKVIRWERDWMGGGRYFDPHHYPWPSLTTLSTHDSEPLAEWWHNAPDEAHTYARETGLHYQKTIDFELRREILQQSHQSGSRFHVNLLTEYLGLIDPIFGWARINIPGLVSPENWSYRYPLTIAEIADNKSLLTTIQGILA